MPLKNSPISNSRKAALVSRRLFLGNKEFQSPIKALIYATAPSTNPARFFACHSQQPSI
jgi:hypothetical protein